MRYSQDLPHFLLGTDGTLFPLPTGVAEAVSCPECAALLEWGGTGWSCPNSLTHTKLIPGVELARRASSADKLRRLPAWWERVLLAYYRRRYGMHTK